MTPQGEGGDGGYNMFENEKQYHQNIILTPYYQVKVDIFVSIYRFSHFYMYGVDFEDLSHF